jgi:5-oxoprolinase (ATP-hydrolysing)
MKLVARGDTTVVDAYLSPVLRRYVNQVAAQLPGVKLQFMQSSGGLADAQQFHGKDAILSGPAGGIVGAARTAQQAGIRKIISFDMGGTSTDVAHFAGEYERAFDAEVAGVRLRAPLMQIHTVAAGGGSICQFDGVRLRVGPDSAGANPGPASYRRGGPLTVTDCNVLLGRIQPEFFPAVFGEGGDALLDARWSRSSSACLRRHRACDRRAADSARRRRGLHPHRRREHGERDQEDFRAARPRRDRVHLVVLRRRGRTARVLVADALGMQTVFMHPLAACCRLTVLVSPT